MQALFLNVLNMSITASWLILAVVVLRLLLKKAPKWVNCMLWALVAVRLVCPFTFESTFSLVPDAQTVSPDIVYSKTPEINSGVPALNNVVNNVMADSFTPDITSSTNPLQVVSFMLSWFWVVGTAVMLTYAVVSWLRLRKKVNISVHLKDNIWICDDISTPFTIGVFKPRIYLPSYMAQENSEYVIAHEYSHMKRRDNFWKPFGFAVLCIHWFNPLCWFAYALFCKDVELACDEKTIKSLDLDAKKAYSNALLSCSTGRRVIAACPVAFSEGNVKKRVNSVLNYKRPGFWITIVAVAAVVAVTVCFLTNPKTNTDEPSTIEPDAVITTEASTQDENKVNNTLDGEALKMQSEQDERQPSFGVEIESHQSHDYKVYTTVTAYGDEGKLWQYKTDEYYEPQLEAVSTIGLYNDTYMFSENGTIVALNAYTGEVKWKNDDFGGFSVASVIDAEGFVYACGYFGPDFYMLDANTGKTVKKIERFDKDYAWAYDIIKEGNRIKVIMESGPDPDDVAPYSFAVNLDDFSYSKIEG